MIAEIIAIGDELANGQRMDTNSAWLSQKLAEIGVDVHFHSTVADDLLACKQVFAIAMGRADCVISTGGLGPTADDLTRQALADATERTLTVDEQSLDHIRQMFESRGKEMPECNRVQAMLPEGSHVVPNPHGTAPGIDLSVAQPKSRVFCLPGVPAEMKEMYQISVHSTLLDIGAGKRVLLHHRMKCFGLGESALEEKLPDLVRRGRKPSVGITVYQATITLRITAEGKDEQECRTIMQPTIDTIRDCLGTLVFGEGDDELQDIVVRQLAKREKSVATCEWGTEGILARWLREASADSNAYAGGLVIGTNQALPESLAGAATALPGRVDQDAVHDMAIRIREFFDADFGLVTGPLPAGGAEDPHGEIFVGLSDAENTSVEPKKFAGHPGIVLSRSAKQALNRLRLHIIDGDS